jgi:hypothetical protein
MPKMLFDLEVGEISAVSSAATGRKFLIVKTAQQASSAIRERQKGMSDPNIQNHSSGSAWALIQELANDRIHKWGECQAMPEAVAKVISDHPDLYDRYLAQQQATSEKEERQRSYDAAVAWSKIKARANDMVAKEVGHHHENMKIRSAPYHSVLLVLYLLPIALLAKQLLSLLIMASASLKRRRH